MHPEVSCPCPSKIISVPVFGLYKHLVVDYLFQLAQHTLRLFKLSPNCLHAFHALNVYLSPCLVDIIALLVRQMQRDPVQELPPVKILCALLSWLTIRIETRSFDSPLDAAAIMGAVVEIERPAYQRTLVQQHGQIDGIHGQICYPQSRHQHLAIYWRK